MKRLNFIDSLSAPNHRAAKQWFTHSLMALSITGICICMLQGLELYELFITHRMLNHARQKNSLLDTHYQEKQALENKKSTLAQLRTQIDTCANAPCNPHDTLCMLTALYTLPLRLQTAQVSKNGIDVTAKTTNAREVGNILAQLKQETAFAHIELVSITPDQKDVLFRVKNRT